MTTADPKIAALEAFDAALRRREDVIRGAATVCVSACNVLAAAAPLTTQERERAVTATGGVRFPLGGLLAKLAADGGVSGRRIPATARAGAGTMTGQASGSRAGSGGEEILLEHDFGAADAPNVKSPGIELGAAQAFSRALAAGDDGRTLFKAADGRRPGTGAAVASASPKTLPDTAHLEDERHESGTRRPVPGCFLLVGFGGG